MNAPVTRPAGRLESIDLLRGLVIMLMALDHTRDFFHYGVFEGWEPLDLSKTTTALFLTRWITHFCAPVFVFLAGTSAFLSGTRKSKSELSWFLLTRGLWLVILELTWVKCLGWRFAFEWNSYMLLVIWALGISMIVLAGLIHLPLPAIAAFGLILIFGHNFLDGIQPESWGRWAGWWGVLHAGGQYEPSPGFFVIAGYPLVPWIGVMAAGYAFGSLYLLEAGRRRALLIGIGCAAIALFLLLRGTNLYGDARPWKPQASAVSTILSVLDCVKYPPSLNYLLMTLGPACLLLACLDSGTPRGLRTALVFGRVPLFFYLLHLPVIHGLSVIAHRLRFDDVGWLFSVPGAKAPPGAGFGLAVTYVVWLLILALLYPACRWFADLKQRRKDKWLSYL